jgi:hypothetical protein
MTLQGSPGFCGRSRIKRICFFVATFARTWASSIAKANPYHRAVADLLCLLRHCSFYYLHVALQIPADATPRRLARQVKKFFSFDWTGVYPDPLPACPAVKKFLGLIRFASVCRADLFTMPHKVAGVGHVLANVATGTGTKYH